ncbi:lipopolysaccharide biosynthesis protein [Clostridium tagluense]|uniref:Polysaccharide biosynthesis protein n=1 Tax=Clostridium tagluense TaxID=360422 RepID=A0A401UJK1_9CLOT|nr:oligosaccharide flippase family protein [Clostridium tagluense]GCD09727.1 polysaccharide biosynthesis protein [Clostridium tagluense]
MEKIKKALKSGFIKNIFLVAGGTAFAQLLNIMISPIITRIYSPEEFGVQTMYMSMLAILVIAGSLKYEGGIAIADDDEKAINVVALSIVILVSFVAIIALITFFSGKQFLKLFGAGILFKYRFLIPIGILFAGTYNIFIQWSFRKKEFKSIAKTKFNQAIIQNITKISFGFFKCGSIGLILGSLFGQSAGITTLSMPLIKESKHILRKINAKDMLSCAKRYIKFPLYAAPGSLLNTLGLQLPVFFIAYLYSSKIVGLYGLANVIVSLPTDLIGGSIGDVFYAEIASIGRTEPEKIKRISEKLIKKLILIGLFPLITLVLFGPCLFSIVFGHKWYEAGVYSRILAFLVFGRLIFTPVNRIFPVFERQKEDLYLDIFRVILVLIAFGISKFMSLNSYWAIGLYTLAMDIVYLVTILYARKIMREEIKKKLQENS